MLILTRYKDEKVRITVGGKPLGHVMIASVRGDKVRIGFDFPADVTVDREEVAADKEKTTQASVPGM